MGEEEEEKEECTDLQYLSVLTMPGETPMVIAIGAANAEDMCRGACEQSGNQ